MSLWRRTETQYPGVKQIQVLCRNTQKTTKSLSSADNHDKYVECECIWIALKFQDNIFDHIHIVFNLSFMLLPILQLVLSLYAVMSSVFELSIFVCGAREFLVWGWLMTIQILYRFFTGGNYMYFKSVSVYH